jgi:hypothetical protein
VSDLITRTARLVPYTKRPKQVASFVTAYAYEPLADEPGAQLGSLYVVMEVLVSGRASEEVADLIIETIGDQYYNQPHPVNDPLTRFESAIKATNQELGEHVNRGNAAWIGKLSAIVAIQVGSEIHIAGTGSAEAFLYRGKASTRISSDGTSRPATPTKTFGSIATGQLEPGDRLLLATPALVHQVPLQKLHSVVGQSSPNAAIAEITQLLRGASVDRIASLVIEVTTPELAALQVRSEQPSEIQLGTPENAFEAAKFAAAPLTKTTLASSKKIAHLARSGWQQAKPRAQSLGLAAAEKLRQILSTKRGRTKILVGLGIFVLVLAGAMWYNASSAAATKLFGRYQAVYDTFKQGQQQLDNGDKTVARTTFTSSQHELSNLQSHHRQINLRLQHAALPEGEPRTFESLSALISDRLDQIDGLVKTTATTVVNITAKNARPEHFELLGNNAYIFDSANNNALSIANIVTGSIHSSKADMSRLGVIVNTTLSSNNDGIYLLTNKPSVWFYRIDTDTLSEQTAAFGGWPQASAIASYASNLYLLSSDAVYKHVKNATGFSPKSNYLTLTAKTKTATGLAVDGSIYLIASNSLFHYLAGTLKDTALVPSALSSITDLRSTAGGSIIVGTDPTTTRIGLWKSTDSGTTFDQQIAPTNLKTLYDATYDAKSHSLLATTDGRLVRLSVQP